MEVGPVVFGLILFLNHFLTYFHDSPSGTQHSPAQFNIQLLVLGNTRLHFNGDSN